MKLLFFSALESLHIILDCVKSTKDQIEDQDVQAESLRQLANHSRERAAYLTKHIIAKLHILGGPIDLILHASSILIKNEADSSEDLIKVFQLTELRVFVNLDFSIGPLLDGSVPDFGGRDTLIHKR